VRLSLTNSLVPPRSIGVSVNEPMLYGDWRQICGRYIATRRRHHRASSCTATDMDVVKEEAHKKKIHPLSLLFMKYFSYFFHSADLTSAAGTVTPSSGRRGNQVARQRLAIRIKDTFRLCTLGTFHRSRHGVKCRRAGRQSAQIGMLT